MARINKDDLAATEQRIMRHISVSQANLDIQAHHTRDVLIKAVREALAPRPGVRVHTRRGPVEHPTGTGWRDGGALTVYGPGGAELAAYYEWESVERMDEGAGS